MRSMRCLWAVLLTSSVFAADFLGPVTHVLAGDTLAVSRNHRNVPICLNWIDIPEYGQVYGHEATEFVMLQAFGKNVTL